MSGHTRAGMMLLSVVAGVGLGGSARADQVTQVPAQAPATPAVQVMCDFLEIAATKGAASIDPALKPVEKRLKKGPFTQWTEFRQLSRTSKQLAKKKPEEIALKQGSATATLVEIVDTSKARLTVSIENAAGKEAVTQTTLIEAGDYVIHTVVQPNGDGHLVAVTCK